MLSLPEIIERAEQPYVAIRQRVTVPFGDAVERAFSELDRWTSARQLETAGAAFIKYNLVAMPHLEVEFGVPTKARVAGDEHVMSGVLPAGKYASIRYQGHYSKLVEVNGVLIGWAEHQKLRLDMSATPAGDAFGCRLEIYETDPATEPDPNQWLTIVAIRLAD
jgi:effector-binding domain-containing protein